ncbi:MAG: PASTA domain-containing protein [Candidatus Eiseniibacteriota bacterium]
MDESAPPPESPKHELLLPPIEPESDSGPEPLIPRDPWTVRGLKALAGTAIIAAIAFVTGLLLFDEVVMPRFTRGAGDVFVPELSNLNREQSEAILARLGLKLSVTSERFDPAIPRGFVVTQDPEPGRPVKPGRRVSVVLSLGEEFANIPELFGESLRSARLLLDRAGLRTGAVGRVVTAEVGPGLVVATEPPFGSIVPRGTAVNLLLCIASDPEAYVMPDLVGRDATSAERDLEAMGFRVEVHGPPSSLTRIAEQLPMPGARVMRGQLITLTVAGRLIQ